MALPLMRGFSRAPSTFSFTRPCFIERTVLTRSSKTFLPPPSAACAAATTVRPFSVDQRGGKRNARMLFFSMPKPIAWFRSHIFYFLIRVYFDKEFSIKEFKKGATQAFFHVSQLLSKCQFSELEGLVAEDLVRKLEAKCNLLPLSHQKALYADSDEIMSTMPLNVGIHYDEEGRSFVSILMQFYYMTNAQIPDNIASVLYSYIVTSEGEEKMEAKRLLIATYEFQREFTKGALPKWIITRIAHNKILK